MYQPRKEFMETAIEEALRAKEAGDHAVGAVVVAEREIIGKGGQRIKRDNDPTAHAEVVAIREACKIAGSRHLEECVLYTTHEPCPMCASAAVWARMKGIVFGATIHDMIHYKIGNGNKEWSWRTIHIPAEYVIKHGNPQLFSIGEFMREECRKLFHS